MPNANKASSTVKKSAPKATSGPDTGDSAPVFSLPATLIGTASSAALKGKPYILYFYPKDDTSGCTAEACGFRDALPDFAKLHIPVIGVSKDSLAKHEKFAAKYDLTFPLASDEASDVCEKFGVWKQKSMYGRTYMGIERSTFLIDAKGIIRLFSPSTTPQSPAPQRCCAKVASLRFRPRPSTGLGPTPLMGRPSRQFTPPKGGPRSIRSSFMWPTPTRSKASSNGTTLRGIWPPAFGPGR
jgi:peroxiredoxin Q/BCP